VKDPAGPDMDRTKVASSERLSAEELYRAHARFVAGFVLRQGASRNDVEDVVQEVFLVAHRRGGFAPGAAKPTTWLAEIALRVWANRRRTDRRKPRDASDVELAASGNPETALQTQRSLERVQRCLDALDFDHRAVFVLFELEGESCAEIAAALSVPIGTVHSRLHNARKRFRDAYEAGGSDG